MVSYFSLDDNTFPFRRIQSNLAYRSNCRNSRVRFDWCIEHNHNSQVSFTLPVITTPVQGESLALE